MAAKRQSTPRPTVSVYEALSLPYPKLITPRKTAFQKDQERWLETRMCHSKMLRERYAYVDMSDDADAAAVQP